MPAPTPLATDTDPATSETATRLRLAATRLARRLRQLSDAGLSPSQHAAMATIERCGPLTLGRLAEAERVSAPTITRVVDRLEARDLVERSADPDDRRATRVQLTKAGAELLRSIREERTAWLAHRLTALDADARARLLDALDVLEELSDDAGERP